MVTMEGATHVMRYVAAVKNALATALRDTAERSGDSDTKNFTRQRKLTLETLLRLLIGAEGGSLAKLIRAANLGDLSPSAVSKRRALVDPSIFREVFNRFNSACIDPETYRGYRVLAVDGTVVNMPRNPASPSFVQNDSAPHGYNQLHLNPLYDICNRTYFDAVIQPEPQKDEIGALVEMLRRNEFKEKTLILADRGYESYWPIAVMLEKENTDFLIRVKQNRSAMREIAKLPMCELDCTINFTITTTQTNEDKLKRHIYIQVPKKCKPGSKTKRGRWDFPSPYPMSLRIVRFQLNSGEFETLATSLPPSFTLADLKEIYYMRFTGIETSFRDLKYSVGLVNIHGKSDMFVEQEIFASLTAFNFTSRIAREVVIRQPKDGIYAYRVNFKNAVALAKEHIRNPQLSNEDLAREMAKHAVPIRPGRQDQRKLKVKGFVGFTYRVAA